MSTFYYSFQNILDIKKKNREQLEFIYAELTEDLELERDKSSKLIEHKNSIFNKIQDEQVTGTFISEINKYQSYLLFLEQQIANHIINISKIEQHVKEKHDELITIKIEEKKWLKLKEKRMQEFNHEQNRIDQLELDEMASRRVKRGV